MTRAPSSARRLTVPAPIPEVPPVTRATLPANRLFIDHSLHRDGLDRHIGRICSRICSRIFGRVRTEALGGGAACAIGEHHACAKRAARSAIGHPHGGAHDVY